MCTKYEVRNEIPTYGDNPDISFETLLTDEQTLHLNSSANHYR